MDWENAAGLNKYLSGLSDNQKKKIRNGAKVEVCKEMREGWSGELPFYIFWCYECGNFSYDYPHGHIQNQRLNCHRCSARIDFRPWWAGWIEFWELLKFRFSLRGK